MALRIDQPVDPLRRGQREPVIADERAPRWRRLKLAAGVAG
jgi:hypothetical protein